MTDTAINLLLPVVLAIHHVEEVARIQEFGDNFPRFLPNRFRERSSILTAVTLLTLAVTTMEILTCVFRRNPWLLFSRIAIFALLLNALGHCLRSVQQRRVLPGTLSAAILTLPYCAVAVLLMRSSGYPSTLLLREALMAAIILPCVSFAFLAMGAFYATVLKPL